MTDGKETAIVPQEMVQLGTLEVAPEAIVERATRVAEALADVIKKKKLSVKIRNKEYVRVEGWSTLGAMIGVLPRTVSVTEIQEGIFEATVELIRTTDQAVIGCGIAECGSVDEVDRNGKPIWADRPRYARKSMAITRATGKAFRLGLAWIMELAGYSGTPAEEFVEGVIEGEVRDVTPKKNGPRPYSPKQLRQRIQEKSAGYQTEFGDKTRMELHQNIRGAVVGNLEVCFAGDTDSTNKRHSLQAYLFGIDSFNDLSDGQVMALKQWLDATEDSGGEWAPDPLAVKEAQAIVTERIKDMGQDELPMGEAPKEADSYMKED